MSKTGEIVDATKEAELQLRNLGGGGKGFGELLRDLHSREQIPKHVYYPAMDACRIRNRVMHEVGYVVSDDEYRKWCRGMERLARWLAIKAAASAPPVQQDQGAFTTIEEWQRTWAKDRELSTIVRKIPWEFRLAPFAEIPSEYLVDLRREDVAAFKQNWSLSRQGYHVDATMAKIPNEYRNIGVTFAQIPEKYLADLPSDYMDDFKVEWAFFVERPNVAAALAKVPSQYLTSSVPFEEIPEEYLVDLDSTEWPESPYMDTRTALEWNTRDLEEFKDIWAQRVKRRHIDVAIATIPHEYFESWATVNKIPQHYLEELPADCVEAFRQALINIVKPQGGWEAFHGIPDKYKSPYVPLSEIPNEHLVDLHPADLEQLESYWESELEDQYIETTWVGIPPEYKTSNRPFAQIPPGYLRDLPSKYLDAFRKHWLDMVEQPTVDWLICRIPEEFRESYVPFSQIPEEYLVNLLPGDLDAFKEQWLKELRRQHIRTTIARIPSEYLTSYSTIARIPPEYLVALPSEYLEMVNALAKIPAEHLVSGDIPAELWHYASKLLFPHGRRLKIV